MGPWCCSLQPQKKTGKYSSETTCLAMNSQISGTWTLKVCKIMALMAVIMGLGLLFYILLAFR